MDPGADSGGLFGSLAGQRAVPFPDREEKLSRACQPRAMRYGEIEAAKVGTCAAG